MDPIHIKLKACCGRAVELRGTRRCQSGLGVGGRRSDVLKAFQALQKSSTNLTLDMATVAAACTTPSHPSKSRGTAK